MRGCLVTGTDTGVGKTVLAAAILAALRERGTEVRALKPVITGLDEPATGEWPADHVLLARVSGATPEEVAPLRYGPAVGPQLAAELTACAIEPAFLRAMIERLSGGHEVLIVEGVGGLLVPLAEGYAVRDLARDLGLPLVIAARPGLGTINHTLLTLEAARAAELSVSGVVLTPWPERPGEIERSNRATIARLGRVSVAGLATIDRPELALLVAAGESLPLDDWLR